MRDALYGMARVLVDRLQGGSDGTKGIVPTEDGRVLLVWHTYVSGWHLPGGSAHRGESPEACCARELLEETGVVVTGGPAALRRLARYTQGRGAIVLFVVEDWMQVPTSNLEIARARFFPVDDLPRGTTPATRRSLDEWRGRAPVRARW